MDDLEGKINSILSDPDSLEQILSIARMLGAGGTGGGIGTDAEAPAAEQAPPSEQAPDLGGLGFDPQMISGIVGALNGKSAGNSAALISAIKPYLRTERREKLEKATKLAKMANVARAALGTINL